MFFYTSGEVYISPVWEFRDSTNHGTMTTMVESWLYHGKWAMVLLWLYHGTMVGSTGVDKGGPGGPGPPNSLAGQKNNFFVNIEGLSS